MSVGGLFSYARRALFSKPTPERQLIRLVKKESIRRIVEIGIESIDDTISVLASTVKQARGEAVSYTALDLFDERPSDACPLQLMQGYRQLVASGAKVRLVPGSPVGSLVREANSLADTDLLLISQSVSDDALDPAWFYLPRMCHPGTLVYRLAPSETDDTPAEWQPIGLDEVARLATPPAARLAA
ncbi:MAG: hypothetical protein AAF266_06950 [Planctomycetota bacterium]